MKVTSSSGCISGTPYFCASALPGDPTQINIHSGDAQQLEAGAPALRPLRVWVNDGCNGVPGVEVIFDVVGGGGTVDGQDSVVVQTGMTGHAEASFIAGPDGYNQYIEATFEGYSGRPVCFALSATPRDPIVPTSFVGIVMDNGNQPIPGIPVMLQPEGSNGRMTLTDADGKFGFRDSIGDGPGVLCVNGCLTSGRFDEDGFESVLEYPDLQFDVVLAPNTENSMPGPIRLPRLNAANGVEYDPNDPDETVLTVEGIAGLKLTIAPGTVITMPDGVTVYAPGSPGTVELSLNQVHREDVPMPIPDGADPLFTWTLQPAGARFDPPIAMTMPNMAGLAPGSAAFFLTFNHDTGRFEIIASGHVSADGAVVTSDAGSGLSLGGWGGNCPPYTITGDVASSGGTTGNGTGGGGNHPECLSAGCFCADTMLDQTKEFATDCITELAIDALIEGVEVVTGLKSLACGVAIGRGAVETAIECIKDFSLGGCGATAAGAGVSAVLECTPLGGILSKLVDQSSCLPAAIDMYSSYLGACSTSLGLNARDYLEIEQAIGRLKLQQDLVQAQYELSLAWYGDEAWLELGTALAPEMLSSITEAQQGTSDDGGGISDFERQQIFGVPRPEAVDEPMLDELIDRLNRTHDNWLSGLFTHADAGSNNFIDAEEVLAALESLGASLQDAEELGWQTTYDGVEDLANGMAFDVLANALQESGDYARSASKLYYALINENTGHVERGLTDDAGSIQSVTVAANSVYFVRYYDPSSGLIAATNFVTYSNSVATELPVALFYSATQMDTDGDSIPDEVEEILGTRIDEQDSDQDGTSDDLELKAGTLRLSESALIYSIAGQSVRNNANGSFQLCNISAPDNDNDGFSDNYVRVTAVSTGDGPARYAYSECFRIERSETFTLGDLTFTDSPPLSIQSISAEAQAEDPLAPCTDSSVPCETTQICVDAMLSDGTTAALTCTADESVDLPERECLTYYTSNPDIAAVDSTGLVTAGAESGTAYITVVSLGGTAVTAVRVADEDRFDIAIGDAIADGVPGVGAGSIDRAANQDVYVLTTAGGIVDIYLDAQESSTSGIVWSCTDSDGTALFEETAFSESADPGYLTLAAGETYTIVVSSNDGGLGTYSFEVHPAPRVEQALSPSAVAGTGIVSGVLADPYTRHVFTFSGTIAAEVYLDAIGGDEPVRWTLIASNAFYPSSVNTFDYDSGILPLDPTAEYELVIFAQDGATGSYEFEPIDVPAPESFSMSIGDKVSGSIDTVVTRHEHTFLVEGGEEVLFNVLAPTDTFDLIWSCIDPNGLPVFFYQAMNSTYGGGLFMLASLGTYTISIQAAGEMGSAYEFELNLASAPVSCPIGLNEVVSDGVPCAGSGNIESTGSRNLYTFDASADQRLYFEVLSASGFGLNWSCLAPDGSTVFNEGLYLGSGPGIVTMPSDGAYELTVTGKFGGSGVYSFQITEAPDPDICSITLDATVPDDTACAGVGDIETTVSTDVFTLADVPAGQAVSFDALDSSASFGLQWECADSLGGLIFDESFYPYDDPVDTVLELGGTYTITLSSTYGAVGTYRFAVLSNPPPDVCTLTVPATVGPDVPCAGVGNLEEPGAVDLYRFTASLDEMAQFVPRSAESSSITWEIVTVGDYSSTIVFERALDPATGPVDVQVSCGTTYEIRVRHSTRGTGVYEFELVRP